MNLFETKVRYSKVTENGTVKKVTESYLVDALSFTEAEARIIKEMKQYVSGEFTVTAIRRMNISEVFNDENPSKWWLVKVCFITIDEKTHREVKSVSQILVTADDDAQARARFLEGMRDTMADYEISGITETKYLELFVHDQLEAI